MSDLRKIRARFNLTHHRGMKITTPLQNSYGIGSPGTTGVTAGEYGDGVIHQTKLALADVSMSITRNAGDSSGYGKAKLYDFPMGVINVLGVVAEVTVTAGEGIAVDGSGDFALGTTGTSDAVLDGTDVNLCPSSALTDPFVSGVGSGTGHLAAAAIFDGTTTPVDVYLNLIFDAGDVSSDAVAEIDGEIWLTWTKLGDY